jgi:REP element-mobilizing transposase RayT
MIPSLQLAYLYLADHRSHGYLAREGTPWYSAPPPAQTHPQASTELASVEERFCTTPAMPDPIYTHDSCPHPAYQLDWSYSLFWRSAPSTFDWLDQLRALTERDYIRILQHEFRPPNVSRFLISTRPEVAPIRIAQRVKGRLQHLIRSTTPHAFRRNYGLRSIGSTRREKLEQYLAKQLERHPMADPKVQRRLQQYQIYDPRVDLSEPRRTAHSQYWYNLHIVMVNDGRYLEICDDVLSSIRGMILKASESKGHWLSRAAIVPDHIHLTLGCRLRESPEDVALSYMNNVSYACGLKPVLKFGYYVGTFSEYDLGVIPRP